jgi:alkylhydroperoxidase/carboxymuconolactone decarboxylase family protein YurZ
MGVVGAETHQTLSGISAGDADVLDTVIGLREANREGSGLDPRTFALVKIASLIALDAPPASYAWQVAAALDDGVTPEEILGVLRAVAPQVGGPKVIAAAPEIMVALGLALPEEDWGDRDAIHAPPSAAACGRHRGRRVRHRQAQRE